MPQIMQTIASELICDRSLETSRIGQIECPLVVDMEQVGTINLPNRLSQCRHGWSDTGTDSIVKE